MRSVGSTLLNVRNLPRQIFAALSAILSAIEGVGRDVSAVKADMNNSLDIVSRETTALTKEVQDLREASALAWLGMQRRIKALEEPLQRRGIEGPDGARDRDLTGRSQDLSSETADRVRSILARLTPCAVRSVSKLRVGKAADGGYVMLDSFDGVAAGLALDASGNTSWDTDLAARGIQVLQFDEPAQSAPANIVPARSGTVRIARRGQPDTISVEGILQSRLPQAGEDALLLKIAMRGAEWDVCDRLSSDVLRRFRQIVCEFHGLDHLAEREFGERARRIFEKLCLHHFVCHVHGDNRGKLSNVANVPVPESLQVTFVSRAAFEAGESGTEIYPTALDCANDQGRADLYLGTFRFT